MVVLLVKLDVLWVWFDWGVEMVCILVVEDNLFNMKLVVLILDLMGYVVIEVSEVLEGLCFVKVEMFVFILMDIQLLGMDGLEVICWFKVDFDMWYIKVVVLMVFVMKGDEECMCVVGCDDYIVKLIWYVEFVVWIGDLLV